MYVLILINSKRLIFTFKEIAINNTSTENEDPNIFYNKIYLNNIYTKIKVGNPSQEILATFNSESEYLMIKDIKKLYNIEGYKTYNYINSSKTFKNISSFNNEEFITKGYSIINETISLFENKENEKDKEIQNFQMQLVNNFDYNNKSKSLSAEIGLKSINTNNSFINQLLIKKIIDNNIITIKYISDDYGYIYLGENQDIKGENKLINIQQNIYDSSLFQIQMDYVFIEYKGGRTFFSDINLIFFLEQGIILASDGYQKSINETFFKEKIENNICFEKKIYLNMDDFSIINCKDNINLDNFPTLNFEINHKSFSLNSHDLFKRINHIYYFLIAFSPEIKFWVLGKPFLKKFPLTIDYDKNKILFYEESKEDEDGTNAFLILIVIIIAILALTIIIFIVIKLKNKKKLNSNDINSISGSLIK